MNSLKVVLILLFSASLYPEECTGKTFADVRSCVRQNYESCYSPCIEHVAAHRFKNNDCRRQWEANVEQRLLNCSRETGVPYNSDNKPCYPISKQERRSYHDTSLWNGTDYIRYDFGKRFPELSDQFKCMHSCLKGKIESCEDGCVARPQTQMVRKDFKECFHSAPTPGDIFDECIRNAGHIPKGWGR